MHLADTLSLQPPHSFVAHAFTRTTNWIAVRSASLSELVELNHRHFKLDHVIPGHARRNKVRCFPTRGSEFAEWPMRY